VVIGPHTANVQTDVERLIASGAAIQARDPADFVARTAALFTDRARAAETGVRAHATVSEQQGPLTVTLAIIRGTLAAQTTLPGPA